ncbi:hypothetical protein ACTXPD_18595 [Vreelandella alkaliphila]|uniref:DUF2384 domain-containing protein n=2 Tax=Halomonas TaxID=2745 RepID=A0A3D0KGF3_9GAMM|nr:MULTISPECIES: hypothetical protein [Halomonas]HCA02647.1 hypothetical protein [Halomonas campaniensis]
MLALREQYPVDTAPPQHDGPTLTSAHGTAGLRWLFDRRERWGLTMDDLGTLLGGVSRRTLTGWQAKVNNGETVEVSRDMMDRISLLLGIHKALSLITPAGHESMANEWFQKPIDLMGLQGRSIKRYLLEQGSMEALYYIRRNLDAMRG